MFVIALTIHPSAHSQAERIVQPVHKAANSQPVQTPKVEEAVAVTPSQPAPAETPAPQPVPVPTTHEELMQAAGIDPRDYGAVDYIVSHESSWDQDATEPTTGAHGLVQALPFSKTGCGWEDTVCTLAWGQQYAIARYGGWQEAQAYWASHGNW